MSAVASALLAAGGGRPGYECGILPIGNQIIINENLAAHFELDVMFGADTELQVGLGIHYLY